MSSVVSPSSAATSPLAATPAPSASYLVTLTLNPFALSRLPGATLQILLGQPGSPGVSAKLASITLTGATGFTSLSFNLGASGSVAKGIAMKYVPTAAMAQVLGVLDPNTSQISFKVTIQPQTMQSDWFTVWLLSASGSGFPTTADRSGLFAKVAWSQTDGYTAAAYAGNGNVGLISDTGFSASIAPC